MPTAAKLVSALLFGALTIYVSTFVPPIFEDEKNLPNLIWINGAIAVVLGWRLAPLAVGGSMLGGMGGGLTLSVAVFLTCLFAHSGAEMLTRSYRRTYDGPTEAVVAVFELMMAFGQRVATQQILSTALIGGLCAAVCVTFASRWWR